MDAYACLHTHTEQQLERENGEKPTRKNKTSTIRVPTVHDHFHVDNCKEKFQSWTLGEGKTSKRERVRKNVQYKKEHSRQS